MKLNEKKELKSYWLQDTRIDLEMANQVFEPSLHGLFFAENIRVGPKEKTIDIGTGTGLLAILAAKKGATVCATDISAEAVELAKKNADRNRVLIDFGVGDFFANFRQQFDVIMANLPQKIIINPQGSVEGINGGNGGNEILLKHLAIAQEFMHKNSRMYIFVYTLTNYLETLNYILNNYHANMIAYKTFIEPLVNINTADYLKLNENGRVDIFKVNKQWAAIEYFFELSLK